MMENPTHWLLLSLNDYMHRLDQMEKEYVFLNDLKTENLKWRKRFVEENMKQDSNSIKEYFMSIPSVNFNYFDIDDIVNHCRIIVPKH